MKYEKEFESLWTTFFDVYDTLESFGSHLTKAIWHRVDAFYNFIKTHGAQAAHALQDFKAWMLVLYNRVASHSNLKIRKHIQKFTLKRPFITEHMSDYFFNDFLAFLNQGYLFKDKRTQYTQFSKQGDLIFSFYHAYLTSESPNPAVDLRSLLTGMSRTATHNQMFLICLRLLSQEFGPPGKYEFIRHQELLVLDQLFHISFTDLYFSNRYLCKKFALQCLANYLVVEEVDWKTLFKLFGQMNTEFFSTCCVFVDKEALDAAARLLNKIGKEKVQDAIGDFLNSLFTVKALHQQMPKFGAHYETILKGIANLTLISLLVYQEPMTYWFTQKLELSLTVFDTMLESTYLSNKLVESKIHCFELLMTHLYTYGQDQVRQALRNCNLQTRVGPILDRIYSKLITPLASSENLPSD